MKTLLRMLAVSALLVLPQAAGAAQAFDAKAFADAQAAGKNILVDVTAPWCPTCTRQKPIIESLEKANPDLVVLTVDFDTAKETLKRFKVQSQSTLISFKGQTEMGRSTGQTDPAAIAALVAMGK